LNYIIQNPLSQFEIRDLLILDMPILNNIHLAITNLTEYLVISFVIIIMLNSMAQKHGYLFVQYWALSKECIQDTIFSIVTSQINKFNGQIYYPFILTLFMFILINNLIGLVPYSFSVTSHFILTFSISFSIVIGATILGLQKHKLVFFSLFVPVGCPLALVPALVLIEFISYLARNVSLGLRLAANMLSGHMLLHILSGFTFKIMSSGILFFILGLLPLSFIIAFSGLELAISFIQAQVFVVLSCSYIKDGLDLH